MNVMLVSQCSKRALPETRRILDQFAERRGDRTWQTPITQAGLETLHRLLRATARRNTAVACHWIRGKDHSELIWIVGDAGRFNAQGAVPTNTTERDLLRAGDEDDWRTGEEIRLLASLAALFHDVGKANDFFQKKLKSKKILADPYRHEWVSLRLFQACVGDAENDRVWLQRFAEKPEALSGLVEQNLVCDRSGDKSILAPFHSLPPLAQIVGWLIVSHHRLPTAEFNEGYLGQLPQRIAADWCGCRPAEQKDLDSVWAFSKGQSMASRHWQRHLSRTALQMQARPLLLNADELLGDAYMLHLARLSLMLSDHYYSSLPSHSRYGDAKFKLYANSEQSDGGSRKMKQRLDEHLIGVEVNASRLVRTLPRLEQSLSRIARHRGFRKRVGDKRFRWQDKAFDLATALQRRTEQQGFFGVNMASTGYGKTLANGRIVYGLANPQKGARFNIALGLRTLTLQTGQVYRDRMDLGSEDMAVLVGGGPVRTLYEYHQERAADFGSESGAEFDMPHVHFEGSIEDGPLKRWLSGSAGAQKMLDAPVVICTVDHLIPATESTRGGHQIVPMLRLLTSDLILDEIDDFDTADLPALTRLVHWSGMLGGRVLLSSATLPPAIVEGLFDAYLAGRTLFQRNRGETITEPSVICAWFDEFGCAGSEHGQGSGYREAHYAFVDKRVKRLSEGVTQQPLRRIVRIASMGIVSGQGRKQLADAVAGQLLPIMDDLHQGHSVPDPLSGKQVSFGLVRMAHINELCSVAESLVRADLPEDTRLHLCVYHSQFPLLMRAAIERQLDRLLKRQQPMAVFDDPELRQMIDTHPETQHLFVVLATPVAEVGRDHDYDWAVVEPSSVRSFIQLAGRVRRHRFDDAIDKPNVVLLETNLRHLKSGLGAPAFCNPGFESREFKLTSHSLQDLLTPEQLDMIDSRPRILPREPLQPDRNLADLEHAHLRALMLPLPDNEDSPFPSARLWFETRAHLGAVLQRKQPFRLETLPHSRYSFVPDDDGEYLFMRQEEKGWTVQEKDTLERVALNCSAGIGLWGSGSYREELESLAEAMDMEPADCARVFGCVELPDKNVERGWCFDEAFGFYQI